MNYLHRVVAVAFFGAAVGMVGCDSQAPAAQASESASAPSDVVAVGDDGQMRVDMNAIFPAGEGRDLLLNNCQSCHTWVPVVVLQMDEEQWGRWAVDHRERVPELTDEQFAVLQKYLVSNFNPDRPVPELPPALLESWTGY